MRCVFLEEETFDRLPNNPTYDGDMGYASPFPRVSFRFFLPGFRPRNRGWPSETDPQPAIPRALTFFSNKMPQLIPFHNGDGISHLFWKRCLQVFTNASRHHPNPFQNGNITDIQYPSDASKSHSFKIKSDRFLLYLDRLSSNKRSC